MKVEAQTLQLLLKDKKRPGIPQAGTTRKWNMQHKITKWQMHNKDSILKLKGNQFYSEKVSKVVEDKQFLKNLDYSVRELECLPTGLDMMQGNGANLSDVFWLWSKWITSFKERFEETDDEDWQQMEKFACERYDLISSDAYCASFAIDLRFLGEAITRDELKHAEDCYIGIAGEENWKKLRDTWVKFRVSEGKNCFSMH
jgi:hypothetical protein